MTRLLRVGLEGPFTDGFIYRTQLYAVTHDGQLLRYEVRDIEEALSRRFGALGSAIGALLFHSRGLGATSVHRGAAQRLRATVPDEGLPIEWISLDSLPAQTFDLGIKGHALLDILIYSDRLYLATHQGLWSSPLHPSIRQLSLESRISHMCFSAKVSLGAVAASCGPNGLNMIYDDFSWFGQPFTDVVYPFSIHASYAGLSLANYTSRRDFILLNALTMERFDPERDQATRAINGLEETDFTSAALLERLRAASLVSFTDQVEFIFNRGSTFVVLLGGKVIRVSTRMEEESRRVMTPRLLGEYTGKVSTAQLFKTGVIIETQDSVFLLSQDDLDLVQSGPVATLRVFPRSKRYQELCLMAGERGLVLVGELLEREHAGED